MGSLIVEHSFKYDLICFSVLHLIIRPSSANSSNNTNPMLQISPSCDKGIGILSLLSSGAIYGSFLDLCSIRSIFFE